MGVRQSENQEEYLMIKELLGIPSDEPIFIMRAQDKHAADGISDYRLRKHAGQIGLSSEELPEWEAEVGSIVMDFRNFMRDNPDRVKVPD